jgi:hypothetical protein
MLQLLKPTTLTTFIFSFFYLNKKYNSCQETNNLIVSSLAPYKLKIRAIVIAIKIAAEIRKYHHFLEREIRISEYTTEKIYRVFIPKCFRTEVPISNPTNVGKINPIKIIVSIIYLSF